MNDIEKLKKAWDEFITSIAEGLHLFKLLDWLNKKLGGKTDEN